jgi:hypothetical protein
MDSGRTQKHTFLALHFLGRPESISFFSILHAIREPLRTNTDGQSSHQRVTWGVSAVDPTVVPSVPPILVVLHPGFITKYLKPEYSARSQCQGLFLEGNTRIRWGIYVDPLNAYGWLYPYPICQTA